MNRHTQKTNKRESQRDPSMENNPLHKLFLDELADIYNAEQQLTKALPKMVKAAKSSELREALQSHLQETEAQVSRLEQVAEGLGESIGRNKCEAMEGLIEEGKEIMDDFSDSPALDAALIAAAQKVEHYEIATYGTLACWAEQMGHDDAAGLLRETLEEEKAADEKLNEIAESAANASAEERE